MAAKLKKNVICDFPDNYTIADELRYGLTEEEIRDGIKDFSALLSQLFDVLISISIAAEDELKNPLALLYSIGLCGKFEDNNRLTINSNELKKAYKKTKGTKINEHLQLLQDSGLSFSADNLSKAAIIQIHCPDNSASLIGLKIMAEASARVNTAAPYNRFIYIFARCDYLALSLPKKYHFEIRDVTKFLTAECRDYFNGLHDYLIANKCKYESKISETDYLFAYTSKIKKAKVFSIFISMDTCYVKLNSKLICQQPNLLADAPAGIKNAVKNGQVCAKKDDPNACNPKCAGKSMKFTLDGDEYFLCWILNFILPVNDKSEREYVKQWLEKEL